MTLFGYTQIICGHTVWAVTAVECVFRMRSIFIFDNKKHRDLRACADMTSADYNGFQEQGTISQESTFYMRGFMLSKKNWIERKVIYKSFAWPYL